MVSLENFYIIGAYPRSLHPYNVGFDQKDPRIHMDDISCCLDLCYCIGAGNRRHLFLYGKGYNLCHKCENVICNTCSLHKKTTIKLRITVSSVMVKRNVLQPIS
jgi:hypothetical protein